jgi:hypothetical protein
LPFGMGAAVFATGAPGAMALGGRRSGTKVVAFPKLDDLR